MKSIKLLVLLLAASAVLTQEAVEETPGETAQEPEQKPDEHTTAEIEAEKHEKYLIDNKPHYFLCFGLFARIPVAQFETKFEEMKDFIKDDSNPEAVKHKYYMSGMQSCVNHYAKMEKREVLGHMKDLFGNEYGIDKYLKDLSFDDNIYFNGEDKLTESELETQKLFSETLAKFNKRKRPQHSDPVLNELEKEKEMKEELDGYISKIRNKMYFEGGIRLVLGSISGFLIAALYFCFKKFILERRDSRQAASVELRKTRLEGRWRDLRKMREEVKALEKQINSK